MKYIHSANNPQVKQWKKLLTKKERDKTGTFLVEGFHLVEEAILSGRIEEIVVSENTGLPPSWDYGDIPVTLVTSDIIQSLSDTETPQGVIAICRQPEFNTDQFNGNKYLLIDAVQDPGNLGTMIRTADAAGVDAIIIGDGSVDIYNPKVLRSAQGSHFHLPIMRGKLNDWISKLKKESIPVYGTALEDAKEYTDIETTGKFALIVGNEGSGVRKSILSETTDNLYIPIYGKSESLNVAIATGILLYYLRN
ncbi:RNA methyltransferase [Bacillus sp. DTU_2020_1000418_1_SI_GHA_SEK_038]|uniref:TrmH family RNA methyltransferase n=1 Tax=Bacillus sp. DTU_2020_1000418_1_SI_GHA_SEK_038 TaxID=3077585 RepID=UPI0028EF9A6E|nr:RNA methyltransferase [Bacillus sp. DTU_2020_1000418_1_SI_GHA_SEK_038]WNS74535.1 RNA methyltransferase [Bacillus sp. DTU_2020_1000418_1_SI_GHA_SEK_038]